MCSVDIVSKEVNFCDTTSSYIWETSSYISEFIKLITSVRYGVLYFNNNLGKLLRAIQTIINLFTINIFGIN